MDMKYVKAYFDWVIQMSELTDEEIGRLIKAVLSYAKTGMIPSLSGREAVLFPVFKAQVDRDIAGYVTLVENGRRGGAPKGNRNAAKKKQKQANSTKINQDQNEDQDDDHEKDLPHISPSETLEGIGNHMFSPKLNEKILQWMTYKVENGQGYKTQGFVALLEEIKVKVDEYGESAVIKAIQASMAANYAGIVWSKGIDGSSSKDRSYYGERHYSRENLDGMGLNLLDE